MSLCGFVLLANVLSHERESADFYRGGGGNLLKINCNTKARGSWIITFCVLENTGPCTCFVLYLFMFKKEMEERMKPFLLKERKLGRHWWVANK